MPSPRKNPGLAAKNRVRGSSSKAAVGKRKRHELVLTAAEKRRRARVEAGESLEDFGDPEERGATLLAAHRIKKTPATISIAKMHFQMQDEVDRGLEQRRKDRDTDGRGRASIVAAGKLTLACLAQLGLPGDLEEEIPEPPKKKTKDATQSNPTAPDGLEAWE